MTPKSQPSKRSSFLGIFANFALMVCVTALCLLATDLLIRSALKIPSDFLREIVRFDAQLSPAKRLRPNLNADYTGAYREFKFHVTTDENGFRKTEPRDLNEKLKPEIVVLGDSQTFGVGVNDGQTFASFLSKTTGRPVLNTGCSGYNNYEELALARSIVSYLKPKMFVLAFFAGNDPYENWKETRPAKPSKAPEGKRSCRLSVQRVKEWLSGNSAIYNLAIRLRGLEIINKLFYRFGLVNDVPPAELEIFRKPPSPKALKFWRATDPAILQLNELCRSQGVALVVLFVPDRYQVEPAYWNQWLKKFHLNTSEFDLDLPNQYMQRFCIAHGIRYIDATPALRDSQSREGLMYWRMDNHLAPRGHDVIAQVLADHLKQIQPVAS